MIAEAVRTSVLAGYTDRFGALAEVSDGGLSIHEVPFVAQVNLSADPKDADVMERLASSLGFALPVVPNTVGSREDLRALWMAPDEWLFVGLEGQQAAIELELRNGLNGAFGAIVDVSANRSVLEIHGSRASELLARGVPIDLDARSFGPNRCAQTLLAKAHVVIERRGEARFHVYVRSSFARYAADFLLDVAAGIV